MKSPEIEELVQAVKVQNELIRSLISSKRVVNLDESLLYYDSLVKKYEAPSTEEPKHCTCEGCNCKS